MHFSMALVSFLGIDKPGMSCPSPGICKKLKISHMNNEHVYIADCPALYSFSESPLSSGTGRLPRALELIDSIIHRRISGFPALAVEKESIRNANITSQWISTSHVTVSFWRRLFRTIIELVSVLVDIQMFGLLVTGICRIGPDLSQTVSCLGHRLHSSVPAQLKSQDSCLNLEASASSSPLYTRRRGGKSAKKKHN